MENLPQMEVSMEIKEYLSQSYRLNQRIESNLLEIERLESYGPKFVENIIQAIARDILVFAMKTLRNCQIVAHVHDEIIIEADKRMSLDAVCEQMGRTPPWAKRLLLRAYGYECEFYKKD